MMLSPTCQLIHGKQTLNLLKAESHVKNNQKTDKAIAKKRETTREMAVM